MNGFMSFEYRNELLKPGYLPLESGFVKLQYGEFCVAVLTQMPLCKRKC